MVFRIWWERWDNRYTMLVVINWCVFKQIKIVAQVDYFPSWFDLSLLQLMFTCDLNVTKFSQLQRHEHFTLHWYIMVHNLYKGCRWWMGWDFSMVIEFWDYSGSDPITLIVKKLIWYKQLTFWLYLGVLSHSTQNPLEVKTRI